VTSRRLAREGRAAYDKGMYRQIALAAFLLSPAVARADVQLSFYGGLQGAPHSTVQISGDDTVPDLSFTAGWEGRSFELPPYYGIRATWWRSATFGFGLDLNHTKIYADAETLALTGFDHFEMSDGLNILTVNAYRRWNEALGGLTPYVGGGLGVAIPHVELIENGSRTWGYQVTGPAVAWMAGVSYPITETWSVFGEYKGTYSQNEAELEGGGTLETDVITNAINLGVSFNF
jgi:lipid A oxidase